MHKHVARRLATIGTALGTTLGGAAAAAAASEPIAPGEADPIIVIGYLPPDPQLDGSQLLDQLSGADIAGYGVDSVAELLSQLSAELEGAQGEGDLDPLVVVNGRRISSLGEVADFPTESIRRVEVLLPPAASRFGGGAGQKVINFVLRPQFRSATANVTGALTTEGGGRNGDSAFALTRVFGDNRLSIRARAFTADRLLESERDIEPTATGFSLVDVSDPGRFRTLRPEQRRYSLNAVVTRELGNSVTVSANAGANYETSQSLNGLPPDFVIVGHLGAPLEQSVRGVGGYLGLGANADVGRWSLSITGEYGHRRTRTRTDRPIDTELIQTRVTTDDPALNVLGVQPASLLDDRLTDRAHSRAETSGAVFVASGPLLRVPAGDVRISLRGDLTRSSLTARMARSGLVKTGERDRTDVGGWLNVEVPITSREDNSGGVLGNLSGHFKAAIRSVSDIGTLRSLGYGLSWTPRPRVTLTASMRDDRQPPSLLQLASPSIETSGIRFFDYVNGETVELTQVSGGNPALLPDHGRTLAIGLNLLPFGAGKLRITADYKRIRIDEPVAALPAATAAIQAAFPERFLRDLDGTLVRVDSRPINFAREDRDQLHWGIVFRHTNATGDSGESGENDSTSDLGSSRTGGGVGLRFSLNHTWFLKDEVLLRRGVPSIDLLHGGPAGGNGGQPRHLLQWELGAITRGVGARLTGSWRSGTSVRGGPGAATDLLRFSSLVQHEFRLFADLGDRFPSALWARDIRISLTVANLLNDRQQVRDPSGRTPLIYQPAYLDPLGRTVSLSLRKLAY